MCVRLSVSMFVGACARQFDECLCVCLFVCVFVGTDVCLDLPRKGSLARHEVYQWFSEFIHDRWLLRNRGSDVKWLILEHKDIFLSCKY